MEHMRFLDEKNKSVQPISAAVLTILANPLDRKNEETSDNPS